MEIRLCSAHAFLKGTGGGKTVAVKWEMGIEAGGFQQAKMRSTSSGMTGGVQWSSVDYSSQQNPNKYFDPGSELTLE